MSIQICKIIIYGYKYNYTDQIFSYIDRVNEYDYVNVWGIPNSYYDFRDWRNIKSYDAPCLAYVSDGMNGEYKYLGYIKKVTYIENTNGCDSFWEIEPRFDNWIQERTKRDIELITQTKLGKPELHEFVHYS